MYRVLIATNEPEVLAPLNQIVNWRQMNFYEPVYVETASHAIETMEKKRIDGIGYMLDTDEARKLSVYLDQVRPSMPIFRIMRTQEDQRSMLLEVKKVLDRMHMDVSDEVYNEEEILDMLHDELTHNILAGAIQSEDTLRSRLQMLRSYVSPDKQCVLYDFDLPQGEVYLSSQWHYGSERLENALRNHFFGRYFEDIYYCVAVVNPRHIRLVACQRYDKENLPEQKLLDQTHKHVNDVMDRIQDYLGLDMEITDCQLLDKLTLLTQLPQNDYES